MSVSDVPEELKLSSGSRSINLFPLAFVMFLYAHDKRRIFFFTTFYTFLGAFLGTLYNTLFGSALVSAESSTDTF